MTSSAPADVAVVIPARNGLPDVLDAVASALAQVPPPAEVIVVDDSSTDGTGDAVRARFGSSVQVISGLFGGAAAARNAGWRASTARWIALLDADDLWYEGKLASALELLEQHPQAAWFFSDGRFRTLEGMWHDSWFALYADVPEVYFGQPMAELFTVNFLLTSSVVIRRDALEATGGFNESMSHAEDLDLWIRLARRWPAVGSALPLVRYQHLPSGLTRKVEARLGGNAQLFARLATDSTLEPGLRRRARRRASLGALKLGWAALREGRGADARRSLAQAWMFPERVVPVAMAWSLSLLPRPMFEALKRQSWAKGNVAGPMLAVQRVVLNTSDATAAKGAR